MIAESAVIAGIAVIGKPGENALLLYCRPERPRGPSTWAVALAQDDRLH
jgi:hypothetical protein